MYRKGGTMKRTRLRYVEKNIFQKHIQEHSGIYLMVFFIFLIGFLIGTVNAAFIRDELKTESQNYILNFVEYLKTQEIDNKILLQESIQANIKPIIYIMIFQNEKYRFFEEQ